MSFRKGPFHFGDIDPAKRREELLKRFGLRSEDGHNMFYETSPMGSNWPDWQGRMPRPRGYFEEPAEWRTRQSSFTPSGSNPGSPHFPRSGMGIPHPHSWIPDDDTIPIKVVHEKGASSRVDDSNESDSSSHSSQSSSSQKRTEPRVHHIPIMIEPRDGSASSGYASCDEPAKTANQERRESESPQESDKWQNAGVHRARKSSESEKTVNGASCPSTDSCSPKSSPLNSPQPVSDTSPLGARAKVHSIPIKIENEPPHASRPTPLRSQSAKVATGGQSPSKPAPVNRSASSPLTGQFRSTSRGSHCGKAQPKHGASAPCSPSGVGGPYVTRIPVNVNTDGEQSTGYQQKDGQSCPGNKRNETTQPANSSPRSPAGPLEKIAEIRKEVERLQKCVDEFNGTSKDKEYKFLDEMFTRCMLRLDDIDTGGRDDIRQARKACVNEVHKCVAQLEAKGKVAPPQEHISKPTVDTTLLNENKKAIESEEQQASMENQQNDPESMQVDESQPQETTSEEMQVEMDQKDPTTEKVSAQDTEMQLAENMSSTADNAEDRNVECSMESHPLKVTDNSKTELTNEPVDGASKLSDTASPCQKVAESDANISQQQNSKENPNVIHRSEVTMHVIDPEEPKQQTKL